MRKFGGKKGKKKLHVRPAMPSFRYRLLTDVPLPTREEIQAGIKALSVDPGKTHFALNLQLRRGRSVTTLIWEFKALMDLIGKPLIVENHTLHYVALNRYLASWHAQMADLRLFVVETQLSDEMTRIQQHCISWISIYFPQACIVEIDQNLRYEVFGIPKRLEHNELKRAIVEIAERLAVQAGDRTASTVIENYLSVVRKREEEGKTKRDPFRIHDMTDAYVQVEALLLHVGL